MGDVVSPGGAEQLNRDVFVNLVDTWNANRRELVGIPDDEPPETSLTFRFALISQTENSMQERRSVHNMNMSILTIFSALNLEAEMRVTTAHGDDSHATTEISFD